MKSSLMRWRIARDVGGFAAAADSRCLEKGHWRRFTTKDGLATNYLGYITQAKDDSIWIGYREPYGVSRITLDGGRFAVRTFTEKDGLGSDKALFVGADMAGRIWFGSDRGVDSYNGVRWHHYDQQDGLIWDDCDAASFLADPDGSVWIGTSGGLSHFRPAASVRLRPSHGGNHGSQYRRPSNRFVPARQRAAWPCAAARIFCGAYIFG